MSDSLISPLSLQLRFGPILTDKDLDRALFRIDQIFEAKPGTLQELELEVLVALVETYESLRYPIKEAAKALGRRGGKKGGNARAKALSPARRAEIAQAAAWARWGKKP